MWERVCCNKMCGWNDRTSIRQLPSAPWAAGGYSWIFIMRYFGWVFGWGSCSREIQHVKGLCVGERFLCGFPPPVGSSLCPLTVRREKQDQVHDLLPLTTQWCLESRPRATGSWCRVMTVARPQRFSGDILFCNTATLPTLESHQSFVSQRRSSSTRLDPSCLAGPEPARAGP